MPTLRRSPRFIDDSNGRVYLTSKVNWTIPQLHEWMQSPNIAIHLHEWFDTCIVNEKRSDDAIKWFRRDGGQYYTNPQGLDRNLYDMCIRADRRRPTCERPLGLFYEFTCVTNFRTWPTAKLWARTAWRIAKANVGHHPAWPILPLDDEGCIAFAIDVITLAFHSIVHRANYSVWLKLVSGIDIYESETPETGKSLIRRPRWFRKTDTAKRSKSEEHMPTGELRPFPFWRTYDRTNVLVRSNRATFRSRG